MSLNSNLKSKLLLDYPLKKYLENNRNFYDFSLKLAHFFNYQLNNCHFDFKFEISDMHLLYFDIILGRNDSKKKENFVSYRVMHR